MDGTPFIKMHGLGNDFVVLDARRHAITLDDARARAIADRHTVILEIGERALDDVVRDERAPPQILRSDSAHQCARGADLRRSHDLTLD